MSEVKLPATFPLRLPKSTRLQAVEIAKREGLSLNQFIVLAIAEKLTRLSMARESMPGDKEPAMSREKSHPEYFAKYDEPFGH